jgi:anti-sigma regulatory factor (Ser/Thr protein kinase)
MMDTTAIAANLAGVTNFVRESCGESPKLDLIVEELFLNIAMHACPGGPVHITCMQAPAGVAALEFSYGGPPFDPSTAPDPDLDAALPQRPIGGLGLFLVREMAESVNYRREGELNRLAVEVCLE